MIFLYTNSAEDNGAQPIAKLSIGGYVSSSRVPNDVLNEIFSDISLNTESNNQYRLLALKNTLTYTVDNVTMKFYLNEDIISQIEAALILPSIDSCNEYVFERIPNQYSKPLYGTFTVLTDGITLNIGTLAPNEVMGVWLKRKFEQSSVPIKTCDELADDYDNEVVKELEDNIQIDVDWTEQESVSVSASASASV